MPRTILASCLGGLLFAAAAVPQTQQPPQTPQQTQPPDDGGAKFVVRTTEVILPVTVTDLRGKYVSNLEAKDFRVLQDGKPQRITSFNHTEKQPVVIGFVIDQSNTMRIQWKTFQEAIMELVWALLPDSPNYQGYLIPYGDTAQLAVDTTQDPDKIVARIRSMKPGGNSALFDAVVKACTERRVLKGEPYSPRRIVIVVGDGHDTASKWSLGQAIELAQRNMVTVFGISTANFGFDNPDRDTLEQLTKQTGGRVLYPLENLYKDVSGYLSHPSDDGNYALTVGSGAYASEIANGIIKAVSAIEGDITMQYVLAYAPDIPIAFKPQDYHRIKVELPDYNNTNLNYRPGYYSEPVNTNAPDNTPAPKPDKTPAKGVVQKK
jgi:VWFA-related protein